jgi:hypothetical protein
LGPFQGESGDFRGLGGGDAFSRIGGGLASLSDTHLDAPVDRPGIPDLRDCGQAAPYAYFQSGNNVENVKVRLHRARKKLKAILEKECTFEVDERSVLVCEPVEWNKSGKPSSILKV